MARGTLPRPPAWSGTPRQWPPARGLEAGGPAAAPASRLQISQILPKLSVAGGSLKASAACPCCTMFLGQRMKDGMGEAACSALAGPCSAVLFLWSHHSCQNGSCGAGVGWEGCNHTVQPPVPVCFAERDEICLEKCRSVFKTLAHLKDHGISGKLHI